MKCVDCKMTLMGSMPGSFYANGRCCKCNKIYETKIALKEEADKLIEEADKLIEEINKKETAEKEEKMGCFDMIDFD